MTEYYRIAGLVFSLEYDNKKSPFINIAEKFASVSIEGAQPQIRFIWSDRLPSPSAPATKFGKSMVFDNGFSLKVKQCENFMIQVDAQGIWQVFIAPQKNKLSDRIARFFKKGLKYNWLYGNTLSEMRAKKIIYSIIEPILLAWYAMHDKSMVHCSTVVKNGNAFVFPAWGGVGKTSLMSYFLKHGWDYLCDDIAILDADGKLNYFPLPMHIYGYHKIVCRDMYDRLTQFLKGKDKFIWNIVEKFFSPSKVSRWVRAEDIYTPQRVIHSAVLKHVIHMQRNDSAEAVRFASVSAEKLAHYTTNTIVNEIPLIQILASYTNALSVTSFMPGISQVTNMLETTTANAFASGSCYELIMGKNTTPEEIWEFLQKEFPEELK